MNNSRYGCHNCYTYGKETWNYNKTFITCTIPNCKTNAWCGYEYNVLYCRMHSIDKGKIIRYDHCSQTGCWMITNKRQKNTTIYFCTKHMTSDTEYEYAYVKN